MTSNHVSLHKVIRTSPEKIFRAFTEPAAMAAWLPPYGFVCTVQELNATEGGTYKMTFHNFSTGHAQSFGGTFLEIRPNEFLKYNDQFDDPNLPGVMTTSVWMKKTMAGTELRILQEGIPDAIPIEFCYLGWQDSLDKLTRMTEPEIPDAG